MKELKGYRTDAVRVYCAQKIEDQNVVAKHVYAPSEHELAQAVDEAASEGFERVVVHGPKTWPVCPEPARDTVTKLLTSAIEDELARLESECLLEERGPVLARRISYLRTVLHLAGVEV